MRKVSLVLVFCLLVIVVPVPAQAQGTPPSNAYVLTVQLDYDAAVLQVREEVRYHNLTGDALSSIVFQVTPAAFEGAFDFRGATVDNQSMEARLDGSVLEVPLPRTLAPGGESTVVLDFFVNVPREGDRFGVVNGVFALGNWFPILSVYRTARLTDNGQPLGWSRHQNVKVGDPFFTEAAFYDVTLTSNKPVVVAFTGTLVSKEENRWHMQADRVRDFALAISDRYETLSRTVDGVTISSYYLPGHEAAGEQYLTAAANMLSWLNRAVMPYPYPNLSVAEISGPQGFIIGQEYPGLIFVDQRVSRFGGSVEGELTYLMNHEVAHMWFYGVVGNDQLHEPWFDEGMATWLSLDYYRANNPDVFDKLWRDHVAGVLDSSLQRRGVRPLNTGIYDYSDGGHYDLIVYLRGAAFIEELAQTLGRESFLSALGRYATLGAFKVNTSTSLLDFMQAQTETNLNPLYARYFSFPRYTVEEPLRAQLQAPDKATSGQMELGLSSRSDLRTQVFLDDLPVPSQRRSEGLVIDISAVPAGDYLITVLLFGREPSAQDLIARVVIGEVPNFTPAPSASSQTTRSNESGDSDSGSSPLPIPLPLFFAVDAVVLLALGAGAFFLLRRPQRG